VDVLTPFGFKEERSTIDSCFVHKLLVNSKTGIARFDTTTAPGYRVQWQFYKSAAINIKRLRPDIVHLWGYKSTFPLWSFLRRRKNNPRVVMMLKAVKRLHPSILHSKLLASLQENLSYYLLRNLADSYIVHTEEMANQAKEIGIRESGIALIPTGIDKHDPTIIKEEARRRLRLPPGAFLLLLFGVLREEKSVFEILRLARSLPDNVMLYVVGEDWTHEGVQSFLDKEGERQNVISNLRYLPETEVEMHFRASDAVIIASRSEFVGESGVLLRAAEYEIPILAADHGHSGMLVRNEQLGTVFEYGNPVSFQTAVQELASTLRHDPFFFKSRMKHFKQSRDWEHIIPQYLRLYDHR
jgi:glycosyltransferase involved in cell wall biosynthesis